MRASTLRRFHGLVSTKNISEGTDGISGQMHGDTKCPFSGVKNSGRVWWKGARVQGLECGSDPERHRENAVS